MSSTNGTAVAAARHALPRERRSITHKFCCTGDTLVATADGRNVVSLERLALEKESVSVYAAEPCVVKRASEHKAGARNPSKPTCLCGECRKCRNRDAMRRHRERQRVVRNHKVVDVIVAGVADVYCGDVDSVHNFAVVTSVTDGDALTGKLSGIISHNCIGGHEGYITVGLYDEDDAPGEIFLAGFGKDGSFIQCMMSVWAKSLSNALQYGQPLHKLVTNYLDMRFEPFGATTNPEIPYAKSIPDYVARWLALRFLDDQERDLHGISLTRA